MSFCDNAIQKPSGFSINCEGLDLKRKLGDEVNQRK